MSHQEEETRKRTRKDPKSLDFIIRSGIAGGVAGCVAKTVVAPLDRVKILFQTANPDFQKYAGTWSGTYRAGAEIFRNGGVRGLFQGHSATLLRIFPYTGIKYMVYDQIHMAFMPTRKDETNLKRFAAGSISGTVSVCVTYPLELIRVRLAYITRLQPKGGAQERTELRTAISDIFHESRLHYRPRNPLLASLSVVLSSSFPSSPPSSSSSPPPPLTTAVVATPSPLVPSAIALSSAPATTTAHQSRLTLALRELRARLFYKFPLLNFYRGFSASLLGMVPYAGTSFLTWGYLRASLLPAPSPENPKPKPTPVADLAIGAVSGVLAQTVSYPFEVVRRHMQVGGRGLVAVVSPAAATIPSSPPTPLLHPTPSTPSPSTPPTLSRPNPRMEWLTVGETMRRIWHTQGIRGFYVGLSIGYAKVVPMTATSFAVWQWAKRVLDVQV